MAEIWADWTVERFDGDRAVWRGSLQPTSTAYSLRMSYKVHHLLANVTVRSAQPRVYVDSPRLERRPENPEGVLPHVYWPNGDTNAPDPICAYSIPMDESGHRATI